jgi:hypothetical protein
MNKALVFAVVVVFSTTMVPGCLSTGRSPSNTVDTFYRLLTEGNFGEAYRLVSEKDRNYRSAAEFEGEDASSRDLKRLIWAKTKWKVENEVVADGKATVTVSLRTPNVGCPLGKSLGVALARVRAGNGEDTIIDTTQDQVLSELRNGKVEYVTATKEIHLVLEDENWRILFKWEEEDTIRRTLIRALQLGSEDKIDLAIAELKKVLEADKNNRIAKDYLEILQGRGAAK